MPDAISSFRVSTPDFVSAGSLAQTADAPLNPLAIFDQPGALAGSVPEPGVSLPSLVRERAISSAMERSEQPPLSQVPSRATEAQAKLTQGAADLKLARQEGVDLARMGFFKKCVNIATATITVGVAVGLTALSLGFAAPLLAVACVNLAVTAGDSVCAYRSCKNASALAEGREPPYHLPEGSSCVKNGLNAFAKWCGAADDTAKTVAKVGGGLFQLGLAAAAFALGAATEALPAAHQIATLVANSINALLAGGTAIRTGAIEDGDDRSLTELVQDKANALKALLARVRGGDPVVIESAAHGRPGYTQGLLDSALRSGQEARQLDPNVQGQTPEELRMLALMDDPHLTQSTQRLVSEAVANYGDAKANTVIALGGLIGVGRALLG